MGRSRTKEHVMTKRMEQLLFTCDARHGKQEELVVTSLTAHPNTNCTGQFCI